MRVVRGYSLRTLFICLLSFLLGLLACSILTSPASNGIDKLKVDLSVMAQENQKLQERLKESHQKNKQTVTEMENKWELLKDKFDELEAQHVKVNEEHSMMLGKKDEDLKSLIKLIDLGKDKEKEVVCPTCAPAKVCPVQSSLRQEKRECKRKEVFDLKDYGSKVYKESKQNRLKYEEELKNGRKSLAVHIVSHTHWDREWYRSQEEFNRLLVTIMDGVVDKLMDPYSGVNHFHLDSQSVLLEDYVRSRKSKAGLMEALMNNNQLAVGPWYTQPDEFLVSGESLLRNLFYGMKSVRDMGGTIMSRVGHIPDQFGHTSQMPQIFLGFDMVAASTMRGVNGDQINRNGWWEGPDGSRILLLKFQNYCGISFNNKAEDHDFKAVFGRKLEKRRDKDERWNEEVSTLYYMNGCDHRDLDDFVGAAITKVHEQVKEGYNITFFERRDTVVREVVHSDLTTVAQLVLEEVQQHNISLPVVRGELRKDVGHLSDGQSSGMSLKWKNWVGQELLEKYVEPLHIARLLLLPRARDESDDLERAWKVLLENHFHDTICTTSVPQVFKDAKSRADHVIDIAESLSSQLLVDLMQSLAIPNEKSLFLFNPNNLVQRNALVLAYIRTYRENVMHVGDKVEVRDVKTNQRFNGTCVSFSFGVFEYSHRKHLFRQAYSFNLAKVALTIPLIGPNELRVFEINHESFSIPLTSQTTQTTLKPVWTQDPIFEEIFGTKSSKKEEQKYLLERLKRTKPPKTTGTFLENDHLSVELNSDGSVNILSLDDAFPPMKDINRVAIFSDRGTQYLAQINEEQPPLIIARPPVIVRNSQYQSASFKLGFGLPNVEVRILYVLPKHAEQVLIRVSLTNHHVLQNYAVKAMHISPCSITDSIHDLAFDHVSRPQEALPETKPFHRWTMVYGKNCSFGISGKGLYDSHVGETKLETILMRGVGQVGDWAAFKNDEAQDYGNHVFEYSFIPITRNKDISITAQQFDQWSRAFHSELCPIQSINYGLLSATKLSCVQDSLLNRIAKVNLWHPFANEDAPNSPLSFFGTLDKPFNLTLKREASFLVATVSPSSLILSALKKWENGDSLGVIVRLYNPTNQSIDGHIRFAFPIERAFFTNLNEEQKEEIVLNKSKEIELKVGKYKIVTVLVLVKQ